MPFDFTVGSKTLPAGTYTVTEEMRGVLRIRSLDHRTSVAVFGRTIQGKSRQGSAVLVVNRYGGSALPHPGLARAGRGLQPREIPRGTGARQQEPKARTRNHLHRGPVKWLQIRNARRQPECARRKGRRRGFIYRAGTRILRSSNQFRMTFNSVTLGSCPLPITIKNRPSAATWLAAFSQMDLAAPRRAALVSPHGRQAAS